MSEPVRLWHWCDQWREQPVSGSMPHAVPEDEYLALPADEFRALQAERDGFVRLFDPEGGNVVAAMANAQALASRLAAAEARAEKVVAALRFYANPEHWMRYPRVEWGQKVGDEPSALDEDLGARARAALTPAPTPPAPAPVERCPTCGKDRDFVETFHGARSCYHPFHDTPPPAPAGVERCPACSRMKSAPPGWSDDTGGGYCGNFCHTTQPREGGKEE